MGALDTRTQAADKIGFRHRLCEKVALPDLAPYGLKLVTFMRGFDALGYGPEPEPAAKFHDRFAQPGIEVILVAVRDVAAVDF
jgi:hypothetical protein